MNPQRNILRRVEGLAVLTLLMISTSACRQQQPFDPMDHQGVRWRVAYYEGGPWLNYVEFTGAIIAGLAERGWIEPLDISAYDHSDDSAVLWTFLSEHVQSDYIEFVADAYWSANWDDELRQTQQASAIERLNSGDIDLVIAAGTWAGLDLANDLHSVPTLVISTTDPIGAGIIKSADDSGYDHVIARCDPDRFLRQAQLFYDLTDFHDLGVIYEDTIDGRTYASLNELQTIAGQNGFALHTCTVQDANVPYEEAVAQAVDCLVELAPNLDAFWVSDLRAFTEDNFPGMLAPLMEHHVKTWSAENIELVPRGVLFAMDYGDLTGIGIWYADVIAQIFHGVMPRQIGQVYQSDGKLDINAETARRIGYDIPDTLLAAADDVYEEIEGE